ncbi:MAG: sugar phosphate isomerase/epimerase family protein [Verrucomicrobiales bacterium]
MNHPSRDVLAEIRWMAELKLGFVDLTLEPPAAASWKVDAKSIRNALQDYGLQVVGHTAYYLPLCSNFETIRLAAVDELKRCLEKFSIVGAKWMNIHPDRHAPFQGRAEIIKANIKSLRELLPVAKDVGVGLMIENLPGDFNDTHQLGELLDPLPELGLHLDTGHSNLNTPFNTCEPVLARYGNRLKHVHMHDNKGGVADLHLPLGTGNIDFRGQIRALKKCGYDGTITLEVFSEDKHYFEYSRDVLRAMWEQES